MLFWPLRRAVFVFMSTVKALEGKEIGASAYSQSKYQAEEYILAQKNCPQQSGCMF